MQTPIKNATPLYAQDKIILPIIDVSDVDEKQVDFPPKIWATVKWPSWRTDLWHEFLHQIEDKILNIWRRGEDDPKLMSHAENFLAEKLGVDVYLIRGIK